MEQEKPSGWFGSLFGGNAGGSPTPPSGQPKDTATSMVVHSAPREDAKSNKKGGSLSSAWPMRQSRPTASQGSVVSSASEPPSSANSVFDEAQISSSPYVPSSSGFGNDPLRNVSPPSGSSQRIPQPPMVSVPPTGAPSLAHGEAVDEIQALVRKILAEFEQRFVEQMERRLCEVESKVSGLQEQLEKLHRVIGGLGSSSSLAHMHHDNRSNDGRSKLIGLDNVFLRDENMGEVLSQLQREREEAVQSLQSELHELQQGIGKLSISGSPRADTDDQMDKLENELRLVAEIVQLKRNAPVSGGYQFGNGAQANLLTLPERGVVTTPRSGIMDQSNTFN